MKTTVALSTALLTTCLLTLPGCASRTEGSKPVKQTFVHKYGIEVERGDWLARGQHGRVISTRKDGVTCIHEMREGQKHGTTTYTFPHSDLIATTQVFDHDRLVSEATHYPSGNPQEQTTYDIPGERFVISWYGDGIPRSRELFQADHLWSGEYYSIQNQLEGRVDEGEGTRIVRDSWGSLLSEDWLADGEMIRQTLFYTSGEPKSVTHYCDGLLHGEYATYLEGGLPQKIENYQFGDLHGVTTLFAHGEKKAEIPYEFGYKHGLEKHYGPQGDLQEEISWHHNMRHGCNRFYVDGAETTDWYHQGQLVNERIFASLNPRR